MHQKACPRCGEECWRDSADVGVGVIYGPWGCPSCHWSEDESAGTVKGGWYTDAFGNCHNVERIIENAGRFGLADAAKEAFSE